MLREKGLQKSWNVSHLHTLSTISEGENEEERKASIERKEAHKKKKEAKRI